MTKLYSWNVNGLRACMEKGFREFLEREQPDVLCLQLQIFIIVETDLHDCFPPLVQNLKNITGCIIYQIGPAWKRFRPFWGRKIR